MKTWVHSALSIVLCILFYPTYKWEILFIFAGGVLIDADHYLWYIARFKKWNLIKCYDFFIADVRKNRWKPISGSVLVFHTIEFLIIMILLSFYNSFALMFTIGLLGHYLLDFIWHISVPKMVIMNHSIIYWFYKNKFSARFK